MTDPRPSLAHYPQPGNDAKQRGQGMPVVDGWREMGGNRRWRVPVTDHALCVTSFRPVRRVTWNAATGTP